MRKIDLFKILGSIVVDNKDANKNIGDTESKASGLADKLKGAAGKAVKFGGALGGAAAAGAGALFGMAKKTADATDRIDKMSQKIGLSREGFQELEYVLSQNGTDIEKMQVGFKNLGERMGEAVAGSGKGADAFALLGLSATDSTGAMKSQEQMFEETTKALMLLPEGAEKSALAFDIFGKAGQELMPMLNGTAESFDDLKQNAHDMGLVLSDDAIGSGAAFQDTMDNIQRSMGAVMSKIGAEVMPLIQKGLDWVLEHMPEIQAVVGFVFDKIGKFVKVASDIFSDYLIPVFETVVDWVSEHMPEIQAVIDTVFTAVVELLDAFVVIFQAIWDNWGETIMLVVGLVWDNIKNALKIAFDLIMDLLDIFVKVFTGDWDGLWESIKTLFVNLWDNLKTLLSDYLNNILEIVRTIMTKVKDVWVEFWSGIGEYLSESWVNIKQSVKDGANNVFESVKEMGRNMLEALKNLPADALQMGKDFVMGMINGIGEMGNALKEKVKGMASSALNTTKSLLGIKSPSRKMMEVGSYTAEGFAVGIEDNYDMVEDAMDKLTDFRDGDFNNAFNLNVTPKQNKQQNTPVNSGKSRHDIQPPSIVLNIGSVRDDRDIKKIDQGLKHAMIQYDRSQGVG